MDIQPTAYKDQSWLNSVGQRMPENGLGLRSRLRQPTLGLTRAAADLAPTTVGSRDCEVRGYVPTATWKHEELSADAGAVHSSGRKARLLTAETCTRRLTGGREAFRPTQTPSRTRSLGRSL